MTRRESIVARLEESPLSPWLRALESFVAHRGPARAASLSYTALLALVPLIALILSISKGVLRNQDPQVLSHAIDRFLEYAVPQLQYLSADEAASARQDTFGRIQEAINRINAGALGAFGALTLVSVGIFLLSAIENALNDIWGIQIARRLARRIVYYWAGVTLGPLFLFLAIGITGSNAVAAVLGHLPGAFVVRLFWRILPLAILSTGLMLLYWTMPNTTVPAKAAALGGVTAGTLLQLNNVASAVYFSQVLHYSKVYGSLGAIPVMMVGLYLSWMIVLYGAEVARAAAHPKRETLPFPSSDGARLGVVLDVASAAAADFLRGHGGLSRSDLTLRLGLPDEWVGRALDLLCDGGFFAAVTPNGADDAPPRYLPARPPHQIPVVEILQFVRRPAKPAAPPAPRVEKFLTQLAAAERSELGHVTLEALAAEDGRSS